MRDRGGLTGPDGLPSRCKRGTARDRSGTSVDACEVHQSAHEGRLVYTCRLDPAVDNSGYAGVVRVVREGGVARMDGDALVIEGATSLLLLTRIEHFQDFADEHVEALSRAVDAVVADYAVLLGRARAVQSEMMNRVTVDFGAAAQYGMSTEELLADQRTRTEYSPALLTRPSRWGGTGSSSPAEVPGHRGRDQRDDRPADRRRRAGCLA